MLLILAESTLNFEKNFVLRYFKEREKYCHTERNNEIKIKYCFVKESTTFCTSIKKTFINA